MTTSNATETTDVSAQPAKSPAQFLRFLLLLMFVWVYAAAAIGLGLAYVQSLVDMGIWNAFRDPVGLIMAPVAVGIVAVVGLAGLSLVTLSWCEPWATLRAATPTAGPVMTKEAELRVLGLRAAAFLGSAVVAGILVAHNLGFIFRLIFGVLRLIFGTH